MLFLTQFNMSFGSIGDSKTPIMNLDQDYVVKVQPIDDNDESQSSDVVIVEESEESSSTLSSQTPRHSRRELRPRTSVSMPIKPLRKTVEKRAYRRRSTRGINVPNEAIHLPPPRSLEVEEFPPSKIVEKPAVGDLPSVHDLIDFTAQIGAHLCSSGKQPSSPPRFCYKKQVRGAYSRAHKRRHLAALNSAENEVAEIVQRSRAVFNRLQARASRLDVCLASNFTLKHPFLQSWEKDEDRLVGGQWRERRACYQVCYTK